MIDDNKEFLWSYLMKLNVEEIIKKKEVLWLKINIYIFFI